MMYTSTEPQEGYTEVELTEPTGVGVSIQMQDGRVSQYRGGSVLISGYEPYESVELDVEQMDALVAWWTRHGRPKITEVYQGA